MAFEINIEWACDVALLSFATNKPLPAKVIKDLLASEHFQSRSITYNPWWNDRWHLMGCYDVSLPTTDHLAERVEAVADTLRTIMKGRRAIITVEETEPLMES